MDQQVIDEHIEVALKEMQDLVFDLVKRKQTFTTLSLILSAVDPSGVALEQPVIFAVKPECITPALSDDQFRRLLISASDEAQALAVVTAKAGGPFGPSITVETRGEQLKFLPSDIGARVWDWNPEKHACTNPILLCNRAN